MNDQRSVDEVLADEADAVAHKKFNAEYHRLLKISPSEGVRQVRMSGTRRKVRRQDANHMRPMDWFLLYCLTPPVYPVWKQSEVPWSMRLEVPARPVCARKCIVCGKVHVTSEDCPVQEQYEHVGRTSMVRRDDGYKMQQARNMGAFADADNWEPSRR